MMLPLYGILPMKESVSLVKFEITSKKERRSRPQANVDERHFLLAVGEISSIALAYLKRKIVKIRSCSKSAQRDKFKVHIKMLLIIRVIFLNLTALFVQCPGGLRDTVEHTPIDFASIIFSRGETSIVCGLQ